MTTTSTSIPSHGVVDVVRAKDDDGLRLVSVGALDTVGEMLLVEVRPLTMFRLAPTPNCFGILVVNNPFSSPSRGAVMDASFEVCSGGENTPIAVCLACSADVE